MCLLAACTCDVCYVHVCVSYVTEKERKERRVKERMRTKCEKEDSLFCTVHFYGRVGLSCRRRRPEKGENNKMCVSDISMQLQIATTKHGCTEFLLKTFMTLPSICDKQ